ncbi:MAG: aspartate aminotransferase family protein [Bacillaceae bacterium]
MKRDYLIKPLLGEQYPTVSYAKGVYIYDTNGNKYLDGSSGAVTVTIGHGVQEVIDEMTKQAQEVAFTYRSQFTSIAAERLAKKLADLTPGDVNWTFFVNSGTEAVETAMKTAIQHYQEKGQHSKKIILSRKMSYHGITVGALSLSGHKLRRKRFETLLENYSVVEVPYCLRCPFNKTYPSCNLACATHLEEKITEIGKENIAAFIAEPVVGAAGAAITPPPGYYEEIRKICDTYDILFIADEVMTGLGRTGEVFGINHWNVVPDIITVGKGLTAGYTPMAATIASDRVIEPISKGSRVVMSGHTFSANPLSSATALAVIQYLQKYSLIQKGKEKGELLKKELEGLKDKYSAILDVRGKGLLLGVEFDSAYFDVEKETITNQVIQVAKEKGLLLYPAVAGNDGVEENAVIIAPPLTINNEERKELVRIFEKTIEQLTIKEKA